MRFKWRWFLLIAVPLLGGNSIPLPAPPSNPLLAGAQQQLQTWLRDRDLPLDICLLGEHIQGNKILNPFYRARGYAPAWIGEQGPSVQVDELIRVLESAESEGLRSTDYHLPEILRLLPKVRVDTFPSPSRVVEAASLDLMLTDACLAYATHMAAGRILFEDRDAALPDLRLDLRLASQLAQILAQGQLEPFLRGLAPGQAQYLDLRRTLAQYRAHMAESWAVLPVEPRLVIGDRDPQRIPHVRARLQLLGDMLAAPAPDETLFDDSLALALRHFQARVGLPPTGAFSAPTWSWLNRPPADFIRQLEVNLERWRWLPRDLGSEYILVNIPAFSLQAKRAGQTELQMRVVVGREYRRTPILANHLLSVEINPPWVIPPVVLVKDKLAEMRRDPSFFTRNRITVYAGWNSSDPAIDPATVDWNEVSKKEVVDQFRFRQEPGPNNALGRLKFRLDNPYSIYLHDTPHKELFRADVRDFSSGCIRLEKALDLAEWVLSSQKPWDRNHLLAAIRTGQEKELPLARPIPVYIVYMTAWAEDDGTIQFRRDLYGRDDQLSNAFETAALLPCDAGSLE
jgi:L,D-transpeptidase YcbB